MEIRLAFEEDFQPLSFLGFQDSTLKLLEKELKVEIFYRGKQFIIKSENEKSIKTTALILEKLLQISKKKDFIAPDEIRLMVETSRLEDEGILDKNLPSGIKVSAAKKYIQLKTYQQQLYAKTIRENTITFGIGPAGTGKTYIAVALALNALIEEKVKKIIITRPVIEAGENLGFLPGTLEDKIDPYLKPVMDSIYDMLTLDELNKYKERGQIEIAPLAYMRGRTLNNAFIILDEAQNTTLLQMKMFLTRIGHCSQAVITGDLTQKDLCHSQKSGLEPCLKMLQGIEQIATVFFEKKDVVRHPIVIKILEAFEKYETQK